MKRIFCLSICMLLCLAIMAQTQQGVTYRYNGKKPRTPLGKVTISYDNNKRSVLSDANSGKFTLMLEGLKMGDRIGLVTVKKGEMMVFNQDAVDEWSVRKEALCLILCDADEFELQKENLIAIGKREAKKKYDRQKATLERLLAESKIKQQEYEEKLYEAYEELRRVRKHMDEYADIFARIDESEIDTLAQQAVELFNQGEVERAIKKFEEGRYMEKLDRALRNSQRADQLKAVAEQAKEQASEDSLKAIKSLKAQIEAYKLNYEWQKAGELLKGLADRLNTIDTNWDFALFCSKQKDFKNAETYYLRVMTLLKGQDDNAFTSFRALLLNNLALLYSYAQRFEESETMYKESLEIRRRLALDNPSVYESDVAQTLANFALLYYKTKHFAESEQTCKEALKIYRRLSQVNPSAYEPMQALTLNSLAVLYSDTKRLAESEKTYKEALGIQKRLAQNNPAAHDPDLAMILNNLATLYLENELWEESEKTFKDALEIFRKMAKFNPSVHEADIGTVLNNLGRLYAITERFAESETMYKEALRIRRQLAQDYPSAYEPDLSTTLYYMAVMYKNCLRLTESEELFREALEIYRRLVLNHPSDYESQFAKTLVNLALLYAESELYPKSETMYRKALEVLKHLAQDDPQYYGPIIAEIQTDLAAILEFQGKHEEAEKVKRLKEGND